VHPKSSSHLKLLTLSSPRSLWVPSSPKSALSSSNLKRWEKRRKATSSFWTLKLKSQEFNQEPYRVNPEKCRYGRLAPFSSAVSWRSARLQKKKWFISLWVKEKLIKKKSQRYKSGWNGAAVTQVRSGRGIDVCGLVKQTCFRNQEMWCFCHSLLTFCYFNYGPIPTLMPSKSNCCNKVLIFCVDVNEPEPKVSGS